MCGQQKGYVPGAADAGLGGLEEVWYLPSFVSSMMGGIFASWHRCEDWLMVFVSIGIAVTCVAEVAI